MSSDSTPDTNDRTDMPETPEALEQPDDDASTERKSRILIGSQRDPGVPLPRKKRDWVVPGEEDAAEPEAAPPAEANPPELVVAEVAKSETSEAARPEPTAPEPAVAAAEPARPEPVAAAPVVAEVAAAESIPVECATVEPTAVEPARIEPTMVEPTAVKPSAAAPTAVKPPPIEPTAIEPAPAESHHFPPPNLRGQLSAELEAELEAAMGDESLDDLLAGDEKITSQTLLEPETKCAGRVIAVQREDVFVELGSREQGIVPVKSFETLPEVGAEIEVMVVRFNAAEGLYELKLPHTAASIGDWSDLAEGMVVEARVTGHNSGGLECEINHIRGFIPISQISLYRVEDLAQFVDEKFLCLVTEANPQRRNLVLSHRAVLEREKEEARKELLKSLAPGQIREGVVRKLMDFGAFVDLGGVDGLLHISQLGWGRVAHPRDVLVEGQTIKVKVEKVDLEANRISLGYRDMLENPWNDVQYKFPVNSVVRGKVTKLMEFGAFVELEPGIEGLVHISELSHKRVWRTSDVVHEGDEVEVMIKSIDRAAQRIGLSMKDVLPEPEAEKKTEPGEEALAAAMPKPTTRKPDAPLKGGLGRGAGGEKFGLKW
jgi:small subunit ribosomal protein S1